jgi:hypothetical protein
MSIKTELSDTDPEWQTMATVPCDRDLELAVIDADGIHRLVFPCRRARIGWMNAKTSARVGVRPTHWRQWSA